MKAIKIYKHIIETNLFNINSKRKRKTNESKETIQRSNKNRQT